MSEAGQVEGFGGGVGGGGAGTGGGTGGGTLHVEPCCPIACNRPVSTLEPIK
jgi:hypothetical protein